MRRRRTRRGRGGGSLGAARGGAAPAGDEEGADRDERGGERAGDEPRGGVGAGPILSRRTDVLEVPGDAATGFDVDRPDGLDGDA